MRLCCGKGLAWVRSRQARPASRPAILFAATCHRIQTCDTHSPARCPLPTAHPTPPPIPPPGEIPAFASTHLSSLDLSFNKLGGAIPDSLGAHPSLVSFEAKGNQLTSMPAAWRQAPGSAPVTAPLSYIRLSSNPSLGGDFPLGLATYPNLTLLLLSENRLRWAGGKEASIAAGMLGCLCGGCRNKPTFAACSPPLLMQTGTECPLDAKPRPMTVCALMTLAWRMVFLAAAPPAAAPCPTPAPAISPSCASWIWTATSSAALSVLDGRAPVSSSWWVHVYRLNYAWTSGCCWPAC